MKTLRRGAQPRGRALPKGRLEDSERGLRGLGCGLGHWAVVGEGVESQHSAGLVLLQEGLLVDVVDEFKTNKVLETFLVDFRNLLLWEVEEVDSV